jgi:hypothetical protein
VLIVAHQHRWPSPLGPKEDFMSFCRLPTRVALALALVAGIAGPAGATTIVANGGFETGDLTGWTHTGSISFDGVQCPGPSAVVAQGNCSFFSGAIGATSTLSQLLPTIIGQSYEIRFAFEPDGTNPSFFSASFGANTLFTRTNPPLSAFQFLSFVTTATASSTNLAFTFRDDPGFLFFDAVSVETFVPEPMTLSLVGLGLAAARLLHSRKRSPSA